MRMPDFSDRLSVCKTVSQFIRNVPDFPEPGILFKDITPLLGNKTALRDAIEVLAAAYESHAIDVIVGIDARGFILAGALAYRLGVGFVPIRKKGKLPWETHEVSYDLEYGTDTLAIHQDAFPKQSRVLICDDVLATGGTLAASIELVKKLEGELVGVALLIELTALNGRAKLSTDVVFSLLEF